MSHIQHLQEAKQSCETTGECREYHASLQQQDQEIDTGVSHDVQSAIIWGGVAIVLGFIFLLTPFVKLLHTLQEFLLPKLILVGPILAGLAGGAFLGFAVSFSACYKQSCSPLEETAIFTIPLLSLLLTIPLAIKVYQKRQALKAAIGGLKPLFWIILGVIIILGSASSTVSNVLEARSVGESQKQYLREESEL